MIPRWFKLAYSAFVAVLVPVYFWHYGPANFLWFSNIALLGGLIAVWLESGRLASMMAVSVVLFELGWIIAYAGSLLFGSEVFFDVVSYMFDERIPLFVRALSLYHAPLPFMLLWLVWRLGYDRQAWRVWILLGYGILIASFFITAPERNVNLVYTPEIKTLAWLSAWQWLILVSVLYTAAWWCSHKLIERLMVYVGSLRASTTLAQ